MSWKMTPVLVCDGCGTVIDTDYYILLDPSDQEVVQKDLQVPAERDFCCEACEEWWKAEYPEDGVWGPAWAERDWWRHQAQNSEHVRVRSAHEDMPLVENRSYFDDPEPIG
jgi:hypothetical protein